METNSTNTIPAKLRTLAELLDRHPELPTPYVNLWTSGNVDINWYLHINNRGDEATQRESAQQIVRAIGGKWSKYFDDDEANFKQKRDDFSFHVCVKREAVCTRRVVGTETVTLPAVEAQPERTIEREVVEWDCEPILAEAVASR